MPADLQVRPLCRSGHSPRATFGANEKPPPAVPARLWRRARKREAVARPKSKARLIVSPSRRRNDPKTRKSWSPKHPAARLAAPEGTEWLWGRHAVEAALANPARTGFRRLLLAPRQGPCRQPPPTTAAGRRPRLSTTARSPPCSRQARVHQGYALLAEPLEGADLETIASPARGVILMLDQVTDPQNIGGDPALGRRLRRARGGGAGPPYAPALRRPGQGRRGGRPTSCRWRGWSICRAPWKSWPSSAGDRSGWTATPSARWTPRSTDQRQSWSLGSEGEGLAPPRRRALRYSRAHRHGRWIRESQRLVRGGGGAVPNARNSPIRRTPYPKRD